MICASTVVSGRAEMAGALLYWLAAGLTLRVFQASCSKPHTQKAINSACIGRAFFACQLVRSRSQVLAGWPPRRDAKVGAGKFWRRAATAADARRATAPSKLKMSTFNSTLSLSLSLSNQLCCIKNWCHASCALSLSVQTIIVSARQRMALLDSASQG